MGVCQKYIGDRFNSEKGKWEENVPCEEWKDCFEFHRLSEAKKIIKENIEKYKGSCITKFWANGDFENLGEIRLAGDNKHFIANSCQKKRGY